MQRKLRSAHLAVGLAGLMAFLYTGAYMRMHFPAAYQGHEAVRFLYRANHLYIMFASILNVVLGGHIVVSSDNPRRTLQIVGSLAAVGAVPVLIAAFFREPPLAGAARQTTLLGCVLALAGGMLQGLAGRSGVNDMAAVHIERVVRAPREAVFRAIADAKVFAEAVGGVTSIAYLSDGTAGVGTRFRQSRTLNGRETTMDFEITEWVTNERVRIVNEIHGTVWDSVFMFAPVDGATRLTMRMETRSRPLPARLLMPVMLALFIKKAIARDMDAVKAYCERSSPPGGRGR